VRKARNKQVSDDLQYTSIIVGMFVVVLTTGSYITA